ncbi:MAG TPA: SurA N-terminal domain-containing protein [Patescibacteria group bacterium]|nr:SurA N-terminal domain-containing protein [Patescibacteria group bacterium]
MAKTKTKRTNKKLNASESMEDVMEDPMETMETGETSMMSKSRNKWVLIAGIIVILALAAYKFQYLLIPARVNGKPIFVWEYLHDLNQFYGADVINSLTTQELVKQEIAKQHITVAPADIQAEVDKADKQASASGGLKAVLAAQRITENDFRDQISLQLAVKQILKDKIAVTDTEVEDAYKKNKDFFKTVPQAQAMQTIKDQLQSQKFQSAVQTWITELKKNAKIQVLLPGVNVTPTQ